MPQLINVPGMGMVKFPDGMSDGEISFAIQRNLQSSPPPDPLGDYFRNEVAKQKAISAEKESTSIAGSFGRAFRDNTGAGIGGVVVVFVIGLILVLKLVRSRPLRLLPLAARSATKTKDQMAFDCSDPDAEFFAAAEEEMISGNHDKATWAQALVKANGNEEKRRAAYIVLRVKRMRLQR